MTQEQKKNRERLPSQDEITSVFEKLIQGKKYSKLHFREGAGGVSLYEIEVVGKDGEKIEYNYQKATYDHTNASLPETAQYAASIHAMFYDAEGMPISGMCVANYRDGKWEFVPA